LQVVCSTAGLCNNAKIDALLEEYEAQKKQNNLLSCNQCNNIGNVISQKFHTSSRDQVLDGFLGACGRFSSFSDACSSIVLTYFNEIYNQLSKNLNSDSICHMSGVCASKFHVHEPTTVTIEPKSNNGVLRNKELTDDIPCELCEQLVKHLRDILVANTTENEFKSVLQGLCSQTKGFKSECLNLVDQYYAIIYETLVNNLDANGACFLIGVCRKGDNTAFAVPHMPLLPPNQKNIPKRKRLGENEKAYTNDQIKGMVLPIDKLMGAKANLGLIDGGEKCTMCQYFLHFLQEELSDAKNEDEIKQLVGKTCDKFPAAVRSNCHQFVDLYGDAIIALLVQQIDPRDLCPSMGLCPKNANQYDVDVFAPYPVVAEVNKSTKTECPLCVLVVKRAQDYIKSEKTKETVKKALEKACSRFPAKVNLQCTDFVETYYDELLTKLLSDFTPQDICKDLNLCPKASVDDSIRVGIEKVNFIPHVDTNEIPDHTINGQYFTSTDSGECLLCTNVLEGAENRLTHGMTKEQIEAILIEECSLYRIYEGICENFVKKNVDQIFTLLEQKLSPRQVCQRLSLCAPAKADETIIVNVVAFPAFPTEKKKNDLPHRVQIIRGDDDDDDDDDDDKPKKLIIKDDPVCVLCEFVMTKLEAELKDKKTQEDIKEAVENICSKMPSSISKQCTKFVDQYSDLIIALIDTVPPKEICTQMSLCSAVKKQMHLVGANECTYGPTHFCSDMKIAEKCKVARLS
jgi:saposin